MCVEPENQIAGFRLLAFSYSWISTIDMDMVRMVCMPESEGFCERVFNLCGDLIKKTRHRMDNGWEKTAFWSLIL